MTSPAKRSLLASISLVSVIAFAAAGCAKENQPKPETKVETPTPTAPTAKPAQSNPAQAATPPKLADAAGNYNIDSVHSVVVFAAKHFGAGFTYGTFNKVSGKYVVDADPTKSSVEFAVDAASVFTADKKRDDHLKGPDFFNAKQFPKIEFKSREIKDAGGKFDVTGDLTLHGVTKPVTLTLEHTGTGSVPMDKSFRTGFRGTTTIKRSDYDMKNMLGPVSDEIELTIAIEGIKQ